MQVRLLGPVDVLVDGAARPVRGLRRIALLAMLALHPGEPEPVSEPATGSLAQTGGHTACPQPAAGKATSRSVEVTYTSPLPTAAGASADDLAFAVHSGVQVGRPQPASCDSSSSTCFGAPDTVRRAAGTDLKRR
jgi:hypothetical protein